MHQAGIENVVSSSGTSLTLGQIKLIRRFTNNITVIYDGDAAGIKAALRGIDLLLEEGMNIKVVLLPNGEDPDSFAKKQNAESFINYLKEHETDFIRFKTQLLLDEAGEDPIKKANLISDIVNSISIIPDGIIRSVYTRDCSVILAIDERLLINEVKKRRLASLEKDSLKRVSSTNLPNQVAENHTKDDLVEVTNIDTTKKSNLDKYERAILYYIIRFGTSQMIHADEDNTNEDNSTVLEYIKYDLERDDLSFSETIYKQIFDEAIEHMHDEGFMPRRYFLAHPQQEISKLTANLLHDRYELSKIHMKQYGENLKQEDTPLAEEKNLATSVPRVLTELKDAFISAKMIEISEKMKQKQKTGDVDTLMDLMHELKELDNIKKALAKVLGERVILRF